MRPFWRRGTSRWRLRVGLGRGCRRRVRGCLRGRRGRGLLRLEEEEEEKEEQPYARTHACCAPSQSRLYTTTRRLLSGQQHQAPINVKPASRSRPRHYGQDGQCLPLSLTLLSFSPLSRYFLSLFHSLHGTDCTVSMKASPKNPSSTTLYPLHICLPSGVCL